MVEYDTTDPEAVEGLQRVAKHEDDAASERFAKLLGTYEGREFVWWLLEQAGLYHETFVQGGIEGARESDRLQGQRSFGLKILHRVFTSAGEAYILMQSEAMERAEQRKLKEEHYGRQLDQSE